MKWFLAALGIAAAVLVLAAAAALGWLVGTEGGLHWAAGKVPGLRTEALRGHLAGEIAADKVVYEADGFLVRAEKLSLRAHLAALLGGRLTIEPLQAASIEIELTEAKEKSAKAPELPLRLHIARARADRIEIRRGDARYLVRDVELEHAILGPELSLAGSLYWPDERFPTRAKLQLHGSLENIEAKLAADIAGIAAHAQAQITPFAAEKVRSLEARAGPIDLARFAPAVPHTALDVTLKATGIAGGAFAGTLSAANRAAGPLDAERLPVVRLETSFITDFTSARLQRAHAALHGGGSLAGDAELQAGLAAARLVASGVDLRSIHSRLRKTALSGPLQVRIDGERQWARGSLTQEGIGLTAEVVRVGDTLEVRELGALAEGGAVNGTGRVHLESMAFDAKLAVKAFNPAALGDYPAGSLTGLLSAAGTLDPRRVDLTWDLADSTLYERVFQSKGSARVVGQRVTQADADLRLGANRLSARGAYGRPGDELAFTLEAPRLEELAPIAGSVRARGTMSGSLDNPRVALTAEAENLTVGKERISRATAKLAGSLTAHDLELRATAPELALEVEARLRGGWSAQRGWSGQVLALKNSGEYPVELLAPAALRLAPERVEIGRLEAKVGDGRLVVRDAAWSPGRLATSGEFTGLPAQWLIVAGGLAERLRSTLLLDGEWQLAHTRQLEGSVRVRRAAGDLAVLGEEAIELGLERAALEVRFADGAATGKADIASRVAKAALQGQLTPALAVQGTVEFAELRALAGPLVEGAHIDGRLSAELRLSGTLGAPVFHGTLSGEKLLFELPPWGVALKDGALKATLEGDALRLDSFSIVGDKGGRFTASGMLPLGRDGTARLDWRAEKLHALSRPDRRLVVSGEGEASWDGKRAALKGDLRADQGHFEFERTLPTLGDDVVVAGREPPRPKGSMKLPLALELRLDFGADLTVRGFGFDGKLTGLVDVATTKDGELRAFGRLQAVNATFLAYGQRLDVDPGVVIFDGPIDNPSLQITAWRRNQAVEAGVQISGTVRTPVVQLVSQPPVPEGERLSWLVLGRAPSGATQADLGMLQAAAGALLSGNESVPLDRRIARRFGLDEISLRGTGELTDRVVAVGKRLSDRVYVSYEQGLGTVASNLVKLDYALGRRWTLRAETGTSSGGGLFYRYSWD